MRKTKAPRKNPALRVQAVDTAEDSRQTLLAIGTLMAACRDGKDAIPGQTVVRLGEIIIAEIAKMDTAFQSPSYAVSPHPERIT